VNEYRIRRRQPDTARLVKTARRRRAVHAVADSTTRERVGIPIRSLTELSASGGRLDSNYNNDEKKTVLNCQTQTDLASVSECTTAAREVVY